VRRTQVCPKYLRTAAEKFGSRVGPTVQHRVSHCVKLGALNLPERAREGVGSSLAVLVGVRNGAPSREMTYFMKVPKTENHIPLSQFVGHSWDNARDINRASEITLNA